MADSENKPRDIKNLKARLGRVAPPGQPARPASASPIAPPVAPTASAPISPQIRISSPPPASATVPGSGIAPPPFLTPQVPTPTPPRAADPFATGAATAQEPSKKLTLVVDESAIRESASAKKSRARNFIILGIGAAVGIAVGFMVGNTAENRNQYAAAVRDGKEIYKTVTDVSKEVEKARKEVKAAFDASSGGPGRQASVDYAAIEALVAMKKPIYANAFHRKRYLAFKNPGTVDDLFDYYNNINLLWDKFARLGVQTAGKAKRDILDKAAAVTDEMLNNEYGVVLKEVEENTIFGGLVFVTIPSKAEQAAAAKSKKRESANDVVVKSVVDAGQRFVR